MGRAGARPRASSGLRRLCRSGRCAVLGEADLRRRLGLPRRVEELARLEVELVGDDARRELLDPGVVGLDRVVVDAAGDLDLILSLRELLLELLEVLCRPQRRVLPGADP